MVALLAAQLIAPEPAPLPAGPVWSWLLFEAPWAIGGAVMALTVVSAWALRRAGKGGGAAGALGAGVLMAAGLIALSVFTETDREVMAWSTGRAVERAAAGDHAAFGGMLTERASLRMLGARTRVEREALIARVREDLNGRYALRGKRAEVSRVRACVDGPGVGRTQFRLQCTHEASGYPAGMWWVFHWRLEGGAWKLNTMEMVAFDGLDAGADVGW